MAESKVVPRSSRIGYALGSATGGFGATSVSIFYLFYLTNIAGIPAALAGTVLALPKAWDAFVDPVLGGLVDRHAMRLGKRWPFLLAAGMVSFAAYTAMFSLPHLSSSGEVAALVVVLLVVNSMCQTIFGVCQLSLSTEIATKPVDLTTLYSLALSLYTVMNVFGAIAPPFLVTWLGGGRTGYGRMAATGAAVSGILLVASVSMIRRVPVRPLSREASTLSLAASFRATVKNRAFVYLLAYFIVLSAAGAILASFLPYANQYILGASTTDLAVLTGVGPLATIIGYRLAPLVVPRIGVRRTLKLGNGLVIVMYVALFAASYAAQWTNWAANGAIAISSGLLAIAINATLVDVINAPVESVPEVPKGVYFGLVLCGTKLGLSAGSIVAGSLLGAVGFVSGGAHQSALVLDVIRAGYTLLPAAMFAISIPFLNRIRPAAAADSVPSPTTV